MKKILITGGAGFIGSNLCERLAADESNKVFSLDDCTGQVQPDTFFDLQYKIYGDYELVNKIYVKYFSLTKEINIIVANFEGGGISSVPSFQKRKDKYKIVFKYYGLLGFIKAIIYRIGKQVI